MSTFSPKDGPKRNIIEINPEVPDILEVFFFCCFDIGLISLHIHSRDFKTDSDVNQPNILILTCSVFPGKTRDTPCNLMVLVANESSLEIRYT